MYSLNVPLPGAVERLASELYPRLAAFDRVRERRSLTLKRFEDANGAASPAHLRERIRPVLSGAPAVEARIVGVDRFEEPVRGPGPVVYLVVESPGLRRLHRRLVGAFGAVPELEGDAYVPHVTLARGGSGEAAAELAALDVDPIEWTVSELELWSAEYREAVGSVSLPA